MASTTYSNRTNIPTIDERIYSCFTYYFERTPSTFEARQINDILSKCNIDMVCEIIEYTMQTAPRPSWAYARAVCAKQITMGNFTAEAFSIAVLNFRTYHGTQKKTVIEQAYSQREYDPAKVNGPSAADLEEARKL